MNTYSKFCPNVFLAKCTEEHEKGEVILVTTKYGKDNEHIVHNFLGERNGFYFYSITRADGYNVQERAKKRAERYEAAAERAEEKADMYFRKSNKDADFLSLGEPIKVGHHSERRHRKMIDDAWRNTGKMCEQMKKKEEYESKAESWKCHENDINLSMPESLEYFAQKVEETEKIHKGMKDGTIPREHAYSLPYAKKAVNDAKRNYELAKRLWG